MKEKIFAILLTFLTFHTGFSQTIDKEKLDTYFQALESNNKFMGSVAIYKDEKIIYTKSVGFSDVATNKKPNDSTKYRIGSISKTFTATLVFKAIEEKKLTLSQRIEKYFPAIKNADKITVGNLLNHRSGIHNFTNDPEYLEYNTQKKSEKEMIDIIAKAGSDFEPNSKAAYSNSNYVFLTYILEKIYEKPYSEILKEKITTPLKLENTYFGGKINIENNECYSYIYLGSWIKQTETDMSIPLGAGAVISTPSDLVTFSEALFNYKIISKESLESMKTLQDNYGMGLFQIPFYDKMSYGHTGGIDGFSSVFGYFPNENCAFAFTSNGSNYENNNISIVLLSSLFNQPFEIPSFEVYELSSEDLDQYLGTYSSDQFPLQITITKADKTLMAQATGQPAFPLEATEKDKFKFDQAGIVLEFNPTEKQMILKQGGGVFKFKKE